ncbi:hypothetical protein MMC22_006753 [Lobaria immixta]|nr:hypothetical protein [Lobaria immixta]
MSELVSKLLTKLVYPSVLLGIGIVGNGVLLSGQIAELKKDMKDEFKEVKAVVKDIKTEFSLSLPGVLFGLGILGNGILLCGQMADVKKDLKEEIKEVKTALRGDFKEIKGDVKEIKTEVKSLTARRTALELKDMEINERMFRDCAEGRKRG